MRRVWLPMRSSVDAAAGVPVGDLLGFLLDRGLVFRFGADGLLGTSGAGQHGQKQGKGWAADGRAVHRLRL